MSGTILLADDSLTIQKVVELTFADTDYRVVAVSSGDELIDRLPDAQPDLIICDVIMPGRDGYEVCQQIKSSSDWLHLPVILLTGTFEPFDRDRAIAAGCSDIITKPFEARKLVDTVERLIGGLDRHAHDIDDGPAVAGDEDVWPEEATPVDVPTGSDVEDFGTQMSAAELDEDGIEFTTSGFAEMEAAGRDPAAPADDDQGDDGLDYDLGSDVAGDFEETTPSAGPPPTPDPSAQTVKIDVSSLRDQAEDIDVSEAAAAALESPPAEVAEAFLEPEAEPFTEVADEPVETATDADAVPAFKDESSRADTSPVDPPEDESEPHPDEAPLRLTDDDVDRIARRVIELASDRLEQIAWDIVPDMAEIVVRQRIRELESEFEDSVPDSVQ